MALKMYGWMFGSQNTDREPNINPQNGRISAKESDCTQEGEKRPKGVFYPARSSCDETYNQSHPCLENFH